MASHSKFSPSGWRHVALAGATASVPAALVWALVSPVAALGCVWLAVSVTVGVWFRARVARLEAEIDESRRESTVRELEVVTQASRLLEQQRVVTEQNMLLEEKNRELNRANHLKGQFLASMSHELRTPLNAIIGFSDLLLEGLHGPLTEAQQDPLHDIRSAGRHLLTLINDILDLSKIEAGSMTLRREPVDAAVCIREAVEMVEPLAQKKAIFCHVELDDRARVVGDALRLRQVALNLLSNAVKFTPKHGRVEVKLVTDGDRVRFTVKDNGIGIAKHDQARIFEAFQQVNDSSNRAAEGTGLGLALVAKLLEPMDGTVWVDSELGEGATFSVELPLLQQADEARLVLPFPGAALPEVVVAEDDEATRHLLGRLLQANGFSVRLLPNGQRTVEALIEKLPRVLVLDLMMPMLDGYAVLERLQSLPGHEGVRVLVFTGHQPDDGRLEPHRHRIRLVTKGSLSTPELVSLVAQLAEEPKRSAA